MGSSHASIIAKPTGRSAILLTDDRTYSEKFQKTLREAVALSWDIDAASSDRRGIGGGERHEHVVQDTTFGEFSVPGRGGLTGLYHAWMARRLRRARLMELRRTVETLRETSPIC